MRFAEDVRGDAGGACGGEGLVGTAGEQIHKFALLFDQGFHIDHRFCVNFVNFRMPFPSMQSALRH
ncbi:hypothetical protein CJ178_31325 [Rhodococcus sp. ACPA4]|nr:hypothetical protein CJ178_31325 [Rhodococcus sp. ACPA4]